MKNAPRPPENRLPDYSKIQQNGLIQQNQQGAGEALENALQMRRQKLAERKMGLSPLPGDSSEQ